MRLTVNQNQQNYLQASNTQFRVIVLLRVLDLNDLMRTSVLDFFLQMEDGLLESADQSFRRACSCSCFFLLYTKQQTAQSEFGGAKQNTAGNPFGGQANASLCQTCMQLLVLEVMIKNLGFTLASDVSKCSHLVAEEAERTIKFLCAISHGLHIEPCMQLLVLL